MRLTDQAAIRHGVRIVLERQDRARSDFIAQVQDHGFSTPEATRIYRAYLHAKVIKFDGHRYTVKHGAFWNRDVLERALAA